MTNQPDDPHNQADVDTWQGPSPAAEPKRRRLEEAQPTIPDSPRAASAHAELTPNPADPSAEIAASQDGSASVSKPESDRSDEWDAVPPPIIAPGRVVFGKYRLLEKIGEGGMGTVWLVDHIEFERKSALKLIKPEVAQNDKGWRRFQREARLMAKLEHPNAVIVYDFRRMHSMAYIEMEYIRGRSLDKLLKERNGQPMPLHWVVEILDQLCSVLQEAHGHRDEKSGKSKPIIHRDLKPSNLMLVDHRPPGRNLKVLDFGIAKMIEDEAPQELTLTGAGDLVGTPAYMSPEQIRGGMGKHGETEIDGRSDLYSVGVLLYQLLTGQTPFKSWVPTALFAAHLTERPRPMRGANPQVSIPAEVERVVMRCLEKDPAKRPQSAKELAQLFRAAAGLPAEPTTGPRSWMLPVVLTACLIIAAALALFLVPRTGSVPPGGDRPDIADNKGRDSWEADQIGSQAADSERKPAAIVWEPEGYQAVEPSQLAPGTDEPMQLRRLDDDVAFNRFGPGLYLPVGYETESVDVTDLVGDWPRVLIRTSDRTRFIRIQEGSYRRGDLASKPALDGRGNSCTPHWVKISGFYLQETEVTNGELEDYLELHPGASEILASWNEYYANLKSIIQPAAKARRFPAANLSHEAAQFYAREVGGRLPTEGQWEFAAKSRDESFVFPWGKASPVGRDQRPRANLSDPFGLNQNFGAAEVKSFVDDETLQHIFDMAGNVREFCRDEYRPYYQILNPDNSAKNPLVDPWAVPEVAVRAEERLYVVRGGSFYSTAAKATSFYRSAVRSGDAGAVDDVGFRLVLECPPRRK
jgi:serine/threonine protein kinase/formylglycine-generating enzyme required for sulfatase activity